MPQDSIFQADTEIRQTRWEGVLAVLHSIPEVQDKIGKGTCLLLAGSEQALSQFPKGNWVGGPSPISWTATGVRARKLRSTSPRFSAGDFSLQASHRHTLLLLHFALATSCRRATLPE